MTAAPACTVRMSSWTVSGFMQIRTPTSRRRAMKPSFDARIVNQVGNPWMLDGKRFLPETGIPIWKTARIRMLLEDWLPDPFAVATWIEKSLTTLGRAGPAFAGAFSSRTTLTQISFGATFSRPGTGDDNKKRPSDRARAAIRLECAARRTCDAIVEILFLRPSPVPGTVRLGFGAVPLRSVGQIAPHRRVRPLARRPLDRLRGRRRGL